MKTYPDKWFNPGDCLFFQGDSFVSRVIEAVSHGNVSHVGIITRNYPDLIVAEAIARGFVINRIYVEDYDGKVFLYRLNDESRAKFCDAQFHDWIMYHVGIPYDYLGAGEIGLHELFRGFHPGKDLKKLFCSEAAVAALQYADVINKDIDPSEITPEDLKEFPIWKESILL